MNAFRLSKQIGRSQNSQGFLVYNDFLPSFLTTYQPLRKAYIQKTEYHF